MLFSGFTGSAGKFMGLLQTCKLRFPRSHISMLTMGLFFPLTLAVFLPGLKRICCSSRSPFYDFAKTSVAVKAKDFFPLISVLMVYIYFPSTCTGVSKGKTSDFPLGP